MKAPRLENYARRQHHHRAPLDRTAHQDAIPVGGTKMKKRVAIRATATMLAMAGAILNYRATFAQGSQIGASIGLDMLRPCGIYESIQSGRQASVTNDETLGMGYCLGLILGIKFLAGAATKNTAYPICVPDSAPSGQVLSVVLHYLRNHPQKLSDNFLYLVMDALLEAWPCH
jgi:Rap1a immunity proteins